MSVRLGSRVCVLLLLGFAGAAWSADEPQMPPFPPPPPASDRVAANDVEREAGAVVLESTVDVAGSISFSAAFGGKKGSTTWIRRERYLVLDRRGAELLSRHNFFGPDGAKPGIRIRGRTVTASGEEYALDPDKDVRDLDVKNARGRTTRVFRTAFFPHVEPGAILDLAWILTESDLPEFESVDLQYFIPIRHMEVRSRGTLLGGGKSFLMGTANRFQWVPFFMGPFPANARAEINGDFDLVLTLTDIPPFPEEPLAPPSGRVAWSVGLMPQPFDWSYGAGTWRENLVLFGNPASLPPMTEKQTVSRAIDPAASWIAYDELGLQTLPPWASDRDVLKSQLGGLRANHADFQKFLRKSEGAETAEQVASIAPADLPARERARRLFDHTRSRLRADPGADSQKNLAKLLASGKADRRDLTLYYLYLLGRAQLPAKMILVLNHDGFGFQPFVESWAPFSPYWVVEVSPPGEPPFYVYAGDPLGSFEAMPDTSLGALAFRQPAAEDGDWSLFRMPTELGELDRIAVVYEATLDPARDEVDLVTRTTFEGAASSAVRWNLRWKGPKTDEEELRKHRETLLTGWLDYWAGIPLPRPVPQVDPAIEPTKPFVIEAKAPWKPEAQAVGEQVLLPAFPPAELFRNALTSETRRLPLWPDGGQHDVRMTWRLPAGWSPAQLPAPVETRGPGGLALRLEFSSQPASASEPGAVIAHAVLDLPHLLPASDYREARAFFEAVQRAAASRLLVGKAP